MAISARERWLAGYFSWQEVADRKAGEIQCAEDGYAAGERNTAQRILSRIELWMSIRHGSTVPETPEELARNEQVLIDSIKEEFNIG